MFSVDEGRIRDSLGNLLRVSNGNVIDMIDQLAAALLPEQGSNELVDQMIACCKKTQDLYNHGGFLQTITDVITEFEKVIDINEYMSKQASVGSVTSTDTGAVTAKIDVDAVKI